MNIPNKYFVSRQVYWSVDVEDGHFTVEVAKGGSDYSNPGELAVRWYDLGEGQEFDDPREAVKAAIRICMKWRMIQPVDAEFIHVGVGCTFGMTMYMDQVSFSDAWEWAVDVYESLPKCDQCGTAADFRWRMQSEGVTI